MFGWLRRQPRRVAPELVRPLPRAGHERDFANQPAERALMTAATAFAAVLLAAAPGGGVARLFGLAVVIGGVLFLAGRFFVKFEAEAVGPLRRVASLSALILLFLVGARAHRETGQPSLLLLPVPTVAVLLSLLLAPRFAVAFVGLLLTLVAMVAWGTPELLSALLVLSAGSLAGALYSFRVRRASRLIGIGAIVGVTQILVLAAITLVRDELPANAELLRRLLIALAHGLASGFLVLALLPAFEKALDRLSDLTLLEFSNQNDQPVLRRLQVEAPGTHHHSFLVGTLSEAAAESIGANGLLCRVGSYFHDIGKMNKPEYFSENSAEARARHGVLSPDMSKLIITAHPKDGIELAQLHKIPRPIQSFIEEHHGTTAVEYFWRIAVKQRSEEEVPKDSYRYAGPRPQSKETAIVMVADSVEAASRTLQEPTPARLEQLVDDIVRMKMDDRQLDECQLTMRELTRIKEAFVQVLGGIHHRRPAYPRDPTGRLSVPLAEVELVPEIESGRAPERVMTSPTPRPPATLPPNPS
ncbi:MAG: HDIG domain-containing protein [Planctomycetes bacterium]|nr:HDIG domain-containing protein [Planctomycetota bacterium]